MSKEVLEDHVVGTQSDKTHVPSSVEDLLRLDFIYLDLK